MKITIFNFLISLLFSFNSFANTGIECHLKMMALLEKNSMLSLDESVGMKGWLSPLKRLEDAQDIDDIQDMGVFSWAMPIRIVRTLEEAKAHDTITPNPHKKGIYIISNLGFNETDMNANKSFIESLGDEKVVWFETKDEDGLTEPITRFVSQNTLSKILDTEEMSVLKLPIYDKKGNITHYEKVLHHDGYFFPRRRGVIEHIDVEKAKEIRKNANHIYDHGYRIYFGTHFEEALQLLEKQQRKHQTNEQNRYASDAQATKEFRFEYARGNAFTTVIISPDGEVVAGNLAMKRDGFFLADTIFYKDHIPPEGASKDKTRPINLAKVTILALSEKLNSLGHGFFDAQVVSGFSVRAKAKYVSRENFFDLLAESSKGPTANIKVEGEWTPPQRR